jgi:hypothetical protein
MGKAKSRSGNPIDQVKPQDDVVLINLMSARGV